MSPIAKRPAAAKKTPIGDKPLVARTPKVSVTIPKGELFVGSFHRLAVKVPAKMSFDDLVFVIPDGPKAGLVSPSRDRLFTPRKPHIMLLVGYEPGTYVLRVLHRVTDDVLFEGKFTVDALWRNHDAGPSLWFTGNRRHARRGCGLGRRRFRPPERRRRTGERHAADRSAAVRHGVAALHDR